MRGEVLLVAVAALASALGVAARSAGLRPHHLSYVLPLLQQSREPMRLLVDVDAGVDDTFGLLLALSTPGVSVEAITCANGNTLLHNVVANVLKILDTAQRLDIPVYAGAAQSILVTPEPDGYFGEDGFGDIYYPNAPDPNEYLQKEYAVDALVRIAAENPGEMTLLALAPLTNIALAIRKDPCFLQNLKQIAFLGGSVEGVGNMKSGVEFNIYMDPEAAQIVFTSVAENISQNKPILLTPWETVKIRNLISMEWRKDVLGAVNSTKISLLNKIEHSSLEDNTTYWASADPIATAVLLNPKLITKAGTYGVSVETQGEHGRGAVFVDYSEVDKLPKNAIIVQEINVESYKSYLLEALS